MGSREQFLFDLILSVLSVKAGKRNPAGDKSALNAAPSPF